MKKYVYKLIENTLSLTSGTYTVADLATGNAKNILQKHIQKIHCNCGGGTFYTKAQQTLDSLQTPAILIQFAIPERLQKTVQQRIDKKAADTLNPPSLPGNIFHPQSGDIGRLFKPENFTGFYYKPNNNKDGLVYISVEEFAARIQEVDTPVQTQNNASFFRNAAIIASANDDESHPDCRMIQPICRFL